MNHSDSEQLVAQRLPREFDGLKLIGVEEHLAFPDIFRNIRLDSHATRQFQTGMRYIPGTYVRDRVADIETKRIPEMDRDGIAVQILGLTSTINTTHFLDDRVDEGVKLGKMVNNAFKDTIDRHPTRFRALADLPWQHPEEAVKELHRAVVELGFCGAMITGSVGGERFLDRPEFDAVLTAFEELDVPLYLHPGIPVKAVWDAYYDIPGRPDLTCRFGVGGWGWHNEVAVHLLRLILTGTLDRHPRLKIVIGHQGEMLPAMLDRIETIFDRKALNLQRSVRETLRSQVWIAISGFLSLAPTQLSISTWGVERVLFAVDYPFVDQSRTTHFLRALADLVSPSDFRKICQTNAEALFRFQA